ncbi:hypothetical protein Pint_15867 [Pistacia integerrima]|uniref:Uncharacterized protein n=1 Tax=Pistacia integerrima TaxID=434235 RepID=A0ACC0ZC74_9ROSI|nr:hypothetical protein Pint_15867 [Pistacia integerrima]
MAAAFSPATPLRLRPYSTVRFLSSYPRYLTKQHHFFPPLLHRHPTARPRFFCSVISAALPSGERTKPELMEYQKVEMGSKVGEFRKKFKIVDIKGGAGADQGLGRVGQTLVVMGWVRTLRVQSSVTFIEVNDGSCLSNMQCVMTSEAEGYDQVESGLITTGASIWIQGTVVASQGSKQKVELKVEKIVVVGKSDPSYPIQKKRVSREYLRTKAHLRPRTNTFGAVARVRNALAYATHKFFQENGFVWISSPIITASDCEGAGEQFCVTTLIPSTSEAADSPVNAISKTKEGLIDWSQDFFGKPAFLTVSGQLNAETYATALSDVYTFGPTFRAENSNTSRHLAEFWMIEPELAFADLNDDMACATAYLQYVVRHILDTCKEDMDFFNTWIEKGIIDRLSAVAETDFVQLTYTDAVELLLRANKKFDFPVKWGCDLQSEHERYITEEAFGGCPVIIRDYPKACCPPSFLRSRHSICGRMMMGKLWQPWICWFLELLLIFALFMPNGICMTSRLMLYVVYLLESGKLKHIYVGELIGGSQREERLEYLEDRLDELKLDKENYWWYLDLRRYGSG